MLSAGAHAQIDQLDKGTLIDGLAREGMSELLLHLVETEPPDNPVVAEKIKIAQYRVQYSRIGQSDAERRHALHMALGGLRQLIQQYDDHEQRPLWQTDLAELLLYEYLGVIHQRASMFLEFGVPTTEQRDAFEQIIAECYEQLADADYRFLQLQTELPREADHTLKRINTGLWHRMMNEYFNLRTQVLLAHAAYFVTLLGDDHRYYRNLGHNEFVRDQADTIDDERRQLLELTIDRLDKFINDPSDPYDLRRTCLALAGRTNGRLENWRQADDHFESATASNKLDQIDLISRLGSIQTMDRAGQTSSALDALDDLDDHPLVKSDLLHRLLVVDLQHRLMLKHAQSKPNRSRETSIADAFEVYTQLLNDPKLSEQSESLRYYVHRRWESVLVDQIAEGHGPGPSGQMLPSAVALAVGQTARVEGQQLHARARAAQEADDLLQAKAFRDEAGPKIRQAVHVLTTLLDREDLSPGTRAGAMFNLGAATYLDGDSNVDQLKEATQIWIALADEMPEQADSERAIAQAVTLLQQWHSRPAVRGDVTPLYKRAVEILLRSFPSSATADAQRYYYATQVLLPDERFAEAIELFGQMPSNHPDYFVARKEMLYALLRIHEAADLSSKESIGKRISRLVERVAEQADRALERTSNDDVTIVRNVAGHCQLVRADLAMAREQPQVAIKLLDRVAEQFADDKELLRLVWGKRILALTAAEQLDSVIDQTIQRMQQFTEDAAQVIELTLDHLDERMQSLRIRAANEAVLRKREQLETKVRSAAEAAAELGRILIDWAQQQELDDGKMLPYRLIFAKALRLSGRPDGALELMTPLLASESPTGDVIHEAGEIYFALGQDDEDFIQAADCYNRIIMGFNEPPYPDMWWSAWMRRFQIMDRLGEDTDLIWLRMRALRHIDPGLGGLRYKREMERLANKYAPK